MPRAVQDILTARPSDPAVVMGILNVTPDSFSDGGKYLDPQSASAQAMQMIDSGAEIIDIGAESTRPGSDPVPPDEQIRRIEQVIPAIARTGAVVSIDTTNSAVAARAIEWGATIINDVSAGRDDPEILSLAAESRAGLVLMHMLGQPRNMQANPQYDDVLGEVKAFLSERIEAACAAGVAASRIVIDPGIGFGKKLEHNLALLGGVSGLADLGCAILIGPSRKRFIGDLGGSVRAEDRIGGTIAACLAARRGGATIFRVHDAAPAVEALRVYDAVISNAAHNS
ncbi:MAG: dihydropteroate synthase [Phycisphaerae bacterium]|jgi:dihydropteroate synthase|nr:dihydropteroate synthase [Phycisphaerae bacterium]MDP7289106.1 dihydropteroate synthase [Phycisphaerae bacterium]